MKITWFNSGLRVKIDQEHKLMFCLDGILVGTVDSEKLKPYRAYIVHFVSLLKVLLSILHLNTIIALFFHF